jgi:primosomal protein N' (replication factor Y)
MYLVTVALDLPLRTLYSYTSEVALNPGTRVSVELRQRAQVGFVLECRYTEPSSSANQTNYKPVLTVSQAELALPADVMQLVKFTANYYHHPLGQTLFTALPALLRKIGEPAATTDVTAYYQQVSLTPPVLKTPLMQQLWEELRQPRSLSWLSEQFGKKAKTIINKWLAAQQVSVVNGLDPSFSTNSLTLNPEQQHIVECISGKLTTFHPALIYGITGSGKTEVFLHLIAKVLQNQRQVLVLIPEINLTPQLLNRFKQRFGYAQIRIINSEINDKARLSAWLNAKAGMANIIIGTRLSVFTPFNNLGLIIVDEEHDESFKQSEGLRYHARDLAVYRAQQLNIPIVLASATPSLESLYNYHHGKYHLYRLTARAVSLAQLPAIKLINLAHQPANHAGISQAALTALAACLARHEMALVFINRRGYAPLITCYDCGWVSSCRYCSTNMVYHHPKRELKCHHCGYHFPVPPACPICHNQYLHTLGHGTQKLEEFLSATFTSARIKRIDRDTTTTKKDWQTIYEQIANREIDILVGTQMLAKGHDFPLLTLVIGLNIDNALFSYDFRAAEDMFNILTQVAGRSGRATLPGEVLLQTNYPTHPVYHYLQAHDFNGFINYTLAERKRSNLPPFSHLALIRLSSVKETQLHQAMQQLAKLTKTISHPGVEINPPVPAITYKLHNRYRGQMLVVAVQRIALHNYLTQLINHLPQVSAVSISIDVDPFEL